jgi:AraC family transcriptional regulator
VCGVHYKENRAVTDFQPDESVKPIQVEVQRFPTRTVAFMRHIGPYDQCGQAWEELMGWAAREGWIRPGMECFGLCYDDPEITPGEQIRYDACITVAPEFEATGTIGRHDLPGGEYAVVRHRGSYAGLGDVYRSLYGHWLPGSGREAADAPSLEKYYNSPADTTPEDLETDVCLPLADAK